MDRETSTVCRSEYTWHRSTPPLVSALADRYVEGAFHRRDHTLELLTRMEGPGAPMRLLAREEIADGTYKRLFFDSANIGGKLSLLDRDRRLYLNFYKAAGEAPFSDAEITNLVALSDVLGKAMHRHRALSAPLSLAHAPGRPLFIKALRARLADRAPRLTARELDVCARVVAGYGTEAIALDLEIGPASVATYRKRAYGKLAISSQNELFALCLPV
ncbi:MAG: LuxR C-terminal-related transcriptional regulator [Rhodospirillum sp.]|nr:LuxR C-terminal-related transcriptional regulator [Rhodospirillum sp.]